MPLHNSLFVPPCGGWVRQKKPRFLQRLVDNLEYQVEWTDLTVGLGFVGPGKKFSTPCELARIRLVVYSGTQLAYFTKKWPEPTSRSRDISILVPTLWSKFRFLLGISVHGHFVGMKRQEGVWIRTREWLRSNRNMKIGRIAYNQVYPDLYITDCYGNYR
jgi:hypothetical protein